MPPPPKTPPPKTKIKKRRDDRLTVYLPAIYAPFHFGAAFFCIRGNFSDNNPVQRRARQAPPNAPARARFLVIFMRFSAKMT